MAIFPEEFDRLFANCDISSILITAFKKSVATLPPDNLVASSNIETLPSPLLSKRPPRPISDSNLVSAFRKSITGLKGSIISETVVSIGFAKLVIKVPKSSLRLLNSTFGLGNPAKGLSVVGEPIFPGLFDGKNEDKFAVAPVFEFEELSEGFNPETADNFLLDKSDEVKFDRLDVVDG